MEIFDHYHNLIKKDESLLNQIKMVCKDTQLQQDGKYVPTGLQVDGVWLGIDFIPTHIEKFHTIVVNNFLIDKLSKGKADISRVLLQVVVDGKHIGNLTEDVSENGAYDIIKNISETDNDIDLPMMVVPPKYLDEFTGDTWKTVFFVSKEIKSDKKSKFYTNKREMRFPLIDVDHITFSHSDFYTPKMNHRQQELLLLKL